MPGEASGESTARVGRGTEADYEMAAPSRYVSEEWGRSEAYRDDAVVSIP